MIKFFYSTTGEYDINTLPDVSESILIDAMNNKMIVNGQDEYYFSRLSDLCSSTNQDPSIGLSQKGGYDMFSVIQQSLDVLNSSVNVLDASVIDLDSSVRELYLRDIPVFQREGQRGYVLGREWKNNAFGQYSFAEGYNTQALNIGAHSEGLNTQALGQGAHAEGLKTQAGNGKTGAHAEGENTIATGSASHAEGYYTTANVHYSHAEGFKTTVTGEYSSHAEGINTIASGKFGSHAEGNHTRALGINGSHAEGCFTFANANNSNNLVQTYNYGAHAEGFFNVAHGDWSHTEGGSINDTRVNIVVTRPYTAGSRTIFINRNVKKYSALILYTLNNNQYIDQTPWKINNVPDFYVIAYDCVLDTSNGDYQVTLYDEINDYEEDSGFWFPNDIDVNTKLFNLKSVAFGRASHIEGYGNIASGNNSHAEGQSTTASGVDSHTEGYYTTASGVCSHAEGEYTTAEGDYSHTEGYDTKANNEAEHASGKYNKSTVNVTQFSVGVGTDDNNRKNALEIAVDSSIYINDLGGYDGTNVDSSVVQSVQQVIKTINTSINDMSENIIDLSEQIDTINSSVNTLDASVRSISVPVISTNIVNDANSDVKTASPKAVKTYVDSILGDIAAALDAINGEVI